MNSRLDVVGVQDDRRGAAEGGGEMKLAEGELKSLKAKEALTPEQKR